VWVTQCEDWYKRLKAAAKLGIAPRLIVLAQNDLVDTDTLDAFDPGGKFRLAGDIVAELLTINPDGTLALAPTANMEED
jgi:hypothetical protein